VSHAPIPTRAALGRSSASSPSIYGTSGWPDQMIDLPPCATGEQAADCVGAQPMPLRWPWERVS